MRLYSSVWQQRLALVTMKLTQQASECKKIKEEADLKSGACGEDKLENNELCRKFRCWRRVSTSATTAIKAK